MFEMWDFFSEMGGLKCGVFFGEEDVFSRERKAPQAGASAGWRLAAKCLGEEKNVGCTSFREERAFFEGEESPAMQGQTRQACLVDRCLKCGTFSGRWAV